jgi:Cu(I)/Ag(I) efflux system membrane fusion protein
MADNNKGANWLSTEEEIRNPYFGEAMLTCGEVKSTIK